MSKIPLKTFKITLQGNTYETKITQGKIIDYELNKVSFSNGFYSSITDIQTLNMIDCMSALYAFFPETRKKTEKGEGLVYIRDLEPEQTKEIFSVMNPFFEWYVSWKKFMSDTEKEEEIKEEKSSNEG